MTPHLAPEARYRLIPHPNTTGSSGCVLDEAAPLDDTKVEKLAQWLTGNLHPVERIGTTNAYTAGYGCRDTYPHAPLYRVAGRQLALNPDYLHYLGMPMVATVLASLDGRFFGFAADGTLIVAVASLDPAYLNEIDEEDAA